MSERALRVLAQSLNVRVGPSTAASVVCGLPRGAVVLWLATSPDGYWHKVRAPAAEGWCSRKYLEEVPATAPRDEFPWMAIAREELGTREVPGGASNPRIVEYLASTTLDRALSECDETAWCSAFANWCVERSGYAGTDSAWARAWLKWGQDAATPRPGCVVVLQRAGNPTHGHVGFLVGRDGTTIQLLGGNQCNAVTIEAYPESRVLGYRVPRG